MAIASVKIAIVAMVDARGVLAQSGPLSMDMSRQAFAVCSQLPPAQVQATAIDPATGDVWMATLGGGLVRMSGERPFVSNQFNSGLAGDLVFDVEVAGGGVWAATNGGLSVFRPVKDEWMLYWPRTQNENAPVITALAATPRGLVAAEWRGRAFRFERPEEPGQPVAIPRTEADAALSRRENTVGDSAPSCRTREVAGNDLGMNRVAIGVHGPFNRTISVPPSPVQGRFWPRADLAAVEFAVAHAGIPASTLSLGVLTATIGYEGYGWGLPEDEIVELATLPHVVAAIGAIPGERSVTAAVAARMSLPWINTIPPFAAQPAVQGNPMVFHCFGNAPRQHRAVFDYAVTTFRAARVAILDDGDSTNRRRAGWWRDYARMQGIPVLTSASASGLSASASCDEALDIAGDGRDTLFYSASAENLLSLIQCVRTAERVSTIVTGPAGADLGTDVLRQDIRIIALLPDESTGSCGAAHSGFATTYRPPASGAARTERDDIAFQSLHAALHLIAALESGDATRSGVCDTLRQMEQSCMGERHYEKEHTAGTVNITEFTSGRWHKRQLPAQ